MNPIPQFPDGRKIYLEDKSLFDPIFRAWQPEISAYTFSNLFAWQEPHNTKISTLNGFYIISNIIENERHILEPLGDGEKAGAILECFELSNDMPTRFVSISKETAEELKQNRKLQIKSDRDNADYIYKSEDLIKLAGRKFDAKRNFINKFKEKHTYEYVRLTQENFEECHQFVKKWCDERICDESDGLAKERCAVYQMLSNIDALGIVGGAIAIDGRIVAFSLGEALNDDTLVIHVEKGDTSLSGIYQMINNEFSIREAENYQFVNREQDLGVPGLRKAKKSYQPVKLGEVYKVTKKCP